MTKIIKLFCSILNIPEHHISGTQIIGGMTNNNYLITTNNKEKYVLRLSGQNSNLLINRQYEFDNVKSLLSLNISPDIIFYDVENGHKITKYIESSQTLSPYSISRYIPEITEHLNKLHNSEIKFNNEFNFLAEYLKYRNIINKRNIEIDTEFLQIEQKFLNLYNVLLDYGISLAPCHNDLVAENILVVEHETNDTQSKKQIFFIDWEYSGMNDPMWDIAALFLESNFTARNEDLFLSYYFRDLSQEELKIKKQQIHIYKILQNQLWYLWTLIKEQGGDDFGNYKQKRLLSSKMLYTDYIKAYS
ncbi:MAG: phosphotransferase [Pasteurellaceae bacterium]|nr:phosphotransferase [Pasteurellaceae bacterium]